MRVLVVDDDIIIRHYFVRSLRRYAEVEEAAGFGEALAKLQSSSFDIVLTDEHMPDGSGRALLAQVSILQARCRRVLMSGDDLAVDDDDADAPCERFFAKSQGLAPVVTWICVVASETRPRR